MSEHPNYIYMRREWLNNELPRYILANIDKNHFAEIAISDGQHVVDLLVLCGDDQREDQRENLELVTQLIEVLLEFRSAYQNATNGTQTR